MEKPNATCAEAKTSLGVIRMHGYNVFAAGPEMLVCDENIPQINDTAQLQCVCGPPLADCVV